MAIRFVCASQKGGDAVKVTERKLHKLSSTEGYQQELVPIAIPTFFLTVFVTEISGVVKTYLILPACNDFNSSGKTQSIELS